MRVKLIAAFAALLLLVPVATASARGSNMHDLRDYARGTWASFVAMTDDRSGLPADTLKKDGARSVQTSTTNIGAYLWSAVVAHRLGLIGRRELVMRVSRTLGTLERMERSLGGQYFNWYDHRTGEKLTYWPPDRERDPNAPNTFRNWLSSVDNGWLAVGLRVIQNSVPELSRRARALFRSMDFGVYYVPERNLVRFHIDPEAPTDPGLSPCCYDTAVSESRIVDYLGISRGQLPPKTYFQRYRTFPDGCDWSWQETRPVGVTRRYFGVDVFEGAYPYRGSLVVPSWGGSMFEALMVDLFVPESDWAPRSWRINHPLTVRAQILHGLVDAEYGYWGFSPANIPRGRLLRLRRRRDRPRPQRQPVQRRSHARRPRLPRVPGPPGTARPTAVGLHERRRHAPRGVPGAALRAGRGAREPPPPRQPTSPAFMAPGAFATA